MDKVRGVVDQEAPLPEGLEYEGHIALLQIAHATVNELRAATRGPVGEIARLEQQCIVVPCGGLDRRAQAGRAPADDHDIPGPAVAGGLHHGLAVHRRLALSQPVGGPALRISSLT